MTKYATGNPVGSSDPRDLYDNAENLDKAVNAEADTFQDRMGKSRLTWDGIVKAGTGDAGVIVPVVQQAVQDVIAGVDGQVAVAENAADRAETASDSAFVNADVYPDVAAGLAAVADGEQFQVLSDDGLEYRRYRKDSATVATEVGDGFPSPQGISEKIDHDFGEAGYLLALVDANGVPYAVFDSNGKLSISGLESPVQDMLLRKSVADKTIEEGVPRDSLFEFKDESGSLAAAILNDGTLMLKDVVLPDGPVSGLFSGNSKAPPLEDAFMFNDGARAASLPERNTQHVLLDATEATWANVRVVFGPSICRIAKNEYYLTADARMGGDYSPISIVGRTVTFNPADRTFTLGALKILAENGEEADGTPFSFLNSNLTYVESGPNKGRILCHFNYMTNPVDAAERTFSPYYVYSDDGGATFSPPIDMGGQFPMSDWKRLNFGPGHGIQIRHGEYAGRLVFPAYRATHLYPETTDWRAVAILSDDGGDTFYVGADLGFPGLNEWQLAEDWKGDLVGVFRIYSSRYLKYTSRSSDGAVSFSKPEIIPEVFGAGTKVGLTQCASRFDFSTPKLIAVCAQQGIDPQSVERVNPTAWVSYDGGQTWPFVYQVATGICQYTECVALDPDHVLIMYGGGSIHPSGNQILAHDVSIKNLIGA